MLLIKCEIIHVTFNSTNIYFMHIMGLAIRICTNYYSKLETNFENTVLEKL